MRTKLWFIATGILGLILVAQLAVSTSRPRNLVLYASWANSPKSLKEAHAIAKTIVLAEVIAVEQGDDLVVPVDGELNDEDRVPTQRVTLNVIKSYKGGAKTIDTVTLFQTGGVQTQVPTSDNGKELESNAAQVILEGDPLYVIGEQYLLMLEDGPNGMQRTISPEGRYLLQKDGSLKAMVDNAMTKEVVSKPAKALEQELTTPDK